MAHHDVWREGKRLVSATELQSVIAKPFLDKWKQSLCSFQSGQCGFVQAKKVAEEAAELGNRIHEDAARFLISGDEDNMAPWSKNIITKLKELKIKKYLIEPESTLIDSESGLAGSPDFVCKSFQYFYDDVEDVVPMIGDFKVKNTLDPLMAFQGCAYRYLIRRIHKVDISKMLIIWAKKKTKSMIVEDSIIDLDPWMSDWKALVKLWNRVNPNRMVNILE